jgi:hypothetical protein
MRYVRMYRLQNKLMDYNELWNIMGVAIKFLFCSKMRLNSAKFLNIGCISIVHKKLTQDTKMTTLQYTAFM